MSDEEIMTMLLSAGVAAGVPIDGIKIKKKTVILNRDTRTLTIKLTVLPKCTVSEIAVKIQTQLGEPV